MKEIVIKEQNNIFLSEIPEPIGAAYILPSIVAKTGDEIYILMHEPQGYIFRSVKDSSGHSGFSATVKDVITRANEYNTKLYLFGTHLKMMQWIVDNQNK